MHDVIVTTDHSLFCLVNEYEYLDPNEFMYYPIIRISIWYTRRNIIKVKSNPFALTEMQA